MTDHSPTLDYCGQVFVPNSEGSNDYILFDSTGPDLEKIKTDLVDFVRAMPSFDRQLAARIDAVTITDDTDFELALDGDGLLKVTIFPL